MRDHALEIIRWLERDDVTLPSELGTKQELIERERQIVAEMERLIAECGRDRA